MTDYIPGQLSSLFASNNGSGNTLLPAALNNKNVASAEPSTSDKKAKRARKSKTGNTNSVDTATVQSSMNSTLVALFDNSIRAEKTTTITKTTTSATVSTSVAKSEKTTDHDNDVVMTDKKQPKRQKNKAMVEQKMAQPQKKRKQDASNDVEEKFEKMIRARALAAMKEDSTHSIVPTTEDKMEIENEEAHLSNDSDDSDSDDNTDTDEQQLKRPRKKDKVQNASRDDDPARLVRTVFIGNLPTSVLNKTEYRSLKKHFTEYGKIEAIRFRSIAFSRPLARRIAFVSKQLHKERDTLNAYMVFDNEASAHAALAANGTVLLEHHLRVDRATGANHFDRKRCVFVGNLSFDAHEESLWRHFNDCGRIVNVRMVRDRKSNVGKGFAYVAFEDKSAVGLAMRLHQSRLGERTIRVQRCLDTRHQNGAPNKGQAAGSESAGAAFEGERAVKGKPVKLQTKRRSNNRTRGKSTSKPSKPSK
ncbi:hypothetical protein BDF19DRAFT_404881 [Syncephalis fuscata]|nr:hypothetical protein BDF19DRAFT_404881 [Syncephalis fuscata]